MFDRLLDEALSYPYFSFLRSDEIGFWSFSDDRLFVIYYLKLNCFEKIEVKIIFIVNLELEINCYKNTFIIFDSWY